MPSAKTRITLAFVLTFLPVAAWAGVNVYPADGPAPTLHVEAPKPLEYKVQKGDSVAVIAKKFSITSKELMQANNLSDAKKLKAGQTLHIPGKTAVAAAAPLAAAPTPPASAKPVVASAPAKAAPAPVAEDAAARKAGKKGEVLDPGVDESTPVKGKKGKKGRFAPAPVAAATPPIVVDDAMRASFGKTGVIANNTDVPQNIRDEFLVYAKNWVDELDKLGVGTITHKKIRQVGDHWEATYRVIIRESLGAEVKRVQYEHTPYVGHITYLQRVYTCEAPTKQAALAGPFTSKNENIREIFSYSAQKKAWR